MDRRRRFEALYADHADAVHAYALRRGDRELADEVVADTFLVVWRRLDDVPGEPRPWLYGVARRALANRRRGAHRVAALRERLRREPAPGDDASAADLEDRVRHALAGLSERDRELLMLVAWEGLAVTEAAEALGVRPGALAMRLHRARARLAAALADEPEMTRVEVGP